MVVVGKKTTHFTYFPSKGNGAFCHSDGITHTKKKRVQTWSETGHTHMLPCFWRSLDVITGEEKHKKTLCIQYFCHVCMTPHLNPDNIFI